VHAQPFYNDYLGYRDVDLPNASYIGERTISLPVSAGMTENDVSDVCTALARVLHHFAA
jgi:dTDP-4-amino-4,6-dideoxygalactose transaminase